MQEQKNESKGVGVTPVYSGLFFELIDFTGGQSCGTGVAAWLIHTNSPSIIISRAPFALKTILARVIKYRLIKIQYLIQE